MSSLTICPIALLLRCLYTEVFIRQLYHLRVVNLVRYIGYFSSCPDNYVVDIDYIAFLKALKFSCSGREPTMLK